MRQEAARTIGCHRVHYLIVVHHHQLPFSPTKSGLDFLSASAPEARIRVPYIAWCAHYDWLSGRLQGAEIIRIEDLCYYAPNMFCEGMICGKCLPAELVYELLACRVRELAGG